MNRTYTRYEARTGRVVDVLDIPEQNYDHYALLLYEGYVSGETHYFVDGQPIDRPAQQTGIDVTTIDVAADEAATLSGLPDPCLVTVSSPATGTETVAVTGGELTLSVGVPGEYAVTVEAFPHLPWETVVHAV